MWLFLPSATLTLTSISPDSVCSFLTLLVLHKRFKNSGLCLSTSLVACVTPGYISISQGKARSEADLLREGMLLKER